MSPTETEPPWYRAGLSFECTRCGACCTGAPGYVWVDEEEIARLAKHLGLTLEEFGRKYLRRVGHRYSLLEKPGGDCIFWDRSAGCTVYPARPTQCRTWPFWPENLETPAAWERTQRACPGAGRGRLYTLEEIEAAARRSPT
ncbi:MAG: YkgJ family cysteine cluster protein [Isosphaeraceae bacterium]|nr:YkgJ family cysteine cluster protein [Isosphaeraceae bacterium]